MNDTPGNAFARWQRVSGPPAGGGSLPATPGEPLPSIHHVQIAIPAGGEEAARAFYAEMLGLQEVEKPENLRGRGGVWFRTGNLQLHLGVDEGFHPARKAHIAFQVDDLSEYRRRLSEAGYEIVEDEPLEGFIRFYVADPFGNRIELLEAGTARG